MKRILCLLLCFLLLTGCSRFGGLVPHELAWTTPHVSTEDGAEETEALEASSFSELKTAIRSFVENHVEHGLIRVRNYSGDVEEDLSRAAYTVSREEPLGAYAVDYMTHDCTLIVSYYEIKVDITFRKTAQELAAILPAGSSGEAVKQIGEAVAAYEPTLVLSLLTRNEPDYAKTVQEYYEQNPDSCMALPEVKVQSYPQTGTKRIVELQFTYPEPTLTLRNMERAVRESLSAASIYVRYRFEAREKLELLFTYLAERFAYQAGESATPIYSALCEGIASAQSMSAVWKLLCDRVGIECLTVHGFHGSQNYDWNMVCLDNVWYHTDILEDAISGTLHLRYDEDMADYYWDMEALPSCPAPKPVVLPEQTEPDGEMTEPEPGTEPDAEDGEPAPEEPEPGEPEPDEPEPQEPPEENEKNEP